MRGAILGILLSLTSCMFVSCVPETKLKTPRKTATAVPDVKSNRELLGEVNASGRWFHAKKTRPIWVQEITKAKTVTTLEGEETVEPGLFKFV